MECPILLKTQFNFNRMSDSAADFFRCIIYMIVCVCVCAFGCMSINFPLISSHFSIPSSLSAKTCCHLKSINHRRPHVMLWYESGYHYLDSLLLCKYLNTAKAPGFFYEFHWPNHFLMSFPIFWDIYFKSKSTNQTKWTGQSISFYLIYIFFDSKFILAKKKYRAINKFKSWLNIEWIGIVVKMMRREECGQTDPNKE